MVAYLDARHRSSDLFDDARCLMAENDRRGTGEELVQDREVAVTDAAGSDTDADLMVAQRPQRDLLDRHRPGFFVDDGGARHASL
jgi:hypothetical protein